MGAKPLPCSYGQDDCDDDDCDDDDCDDDDCDDDDDADFVDDRKNPLQF